MKFSVIIPTWNNLNFLSQCIESVLQNTSDFELIICNNGSDDGTDSFLAQLALKHSNLVHVQLDSNLGFAVAVNRGLTIAKGDYLIVLNDDTIVSPDWAESLSGSVSAAFKKYGFGPVGLVGPVSNNVAGEQLVKPNFRNLSDINSFAADLRIHNRNVFTYVGFLSGFCLLITRDCFNAVGFFNSDFKFGGWEDNDYCLRAQLKGYKLIIDHSTFVFHFGQTTLSRLGDSYTNVFRLNQSLFYSLHNVYRSQKLFSITRVHNGSEYLPEFLLKNSRFVDGMIFVLDRCTDDSKTLCENNPKTIKIIEFMEGFDEYRDRQALIQAAIDCNADWCISLDVDEIMDDNFSFDVAHRLCNPFNPEILGYVFKIFTFWLGNSHYRSDGVFGSMIGLRMWRVLPSQKILGYGHEGLHCSHAPVLGTFNLRQVNYNLLHYGYNSPEKCEHKHSVYCAIDPNPDLSRTGPDGYHHIIASDFSLRQYQSNNSISLCMIVRDEEPALFSFLSKYYSFFNEIVIVDTGSTDRTRQVAEIFGAKVFHFKWQQDFSAARNFAKKQCTSKWIMVLDPDEELDFYDFGLIYDHINSNYDAFIFKFVNYLPNGEMAFSDNVRLFRNLPDIYYSYFVHENISQAARKSNFKVVFSPIIIKHFGYLKTDKTKSLKHRNYEKMLMRQVKVFPHEPITFFHLAFHYFNDNNFERGMETLRHCIKLDSSFFLAYKELGLKHLEKSFYYLSHFSEILPANHYFKAWSNKISDSLRSCLDIGVDFN